MRPPYRQGPHRRPEYRCRLRRSSRKPSVSHAFLHLETIGLKRMQTTFIHADKFRLAVQQLAVAHLLAGRGNIRELGDRRPPRLRSNGRQEVLFRAVPEFDFPGDRAFLFVALDTYAVTEGRK